MNSFLDIDECENHFYSYFYSCISPPIKKTNDNIGKEEFYEPEENYKENKDNSCFVFIDKTTKAFSKDNNKEIQKDIEDKKNINKNDNFILIKREENEEREVKEIKEENEKKGKKEENEDKMELNKIKKERKKCGRKRFRNDNNQNEHNKYSDDNVRRKIKHLVLKKLLLFLNRKIYNIYNGDIGNGIFKKELQTINQSQKSDATINFNIRFLEKNIGNIFSDNISGRFTNFPPNHNKNLIDQLLNEKDEEKRIYFRELFSLNFTDCLKHFRGEEYIKILDGLICFKDMKNEILEKYEEDGTDYYETLKYYLNNYEGIIHKKKARKPRK